MNRRCLYVLIASLVVLCATTPVAAETPEDHPKGEVYGGYHYTRIGGAAGVNGWHAAVTGDVNRWFGVTADFSGAYKGIGGVDAGAHTYTFGPKFSVRGERVTTFAHALFGGFHVSAGFQDFSASTSGFAMMLGGGVDVKVSNHFAVRLIQSDWILWRTGGHTEKTNARISTGLVFRF